MNATQRALLKRYLAENPAEAWHPSWHQQLAMVTGYLFWLLVALLVLFVVVNALSDGWLRARRNAKVLADPDVHPSVVCTCVFATIEGVPQRRYPNPKCPLHGYNASATFNSNHVGVLSISDFKRVDGDAS